MSPRSKKTFHKRIYKKWLSLHKRKQEELLTKHKAALKHIADNSKQYAIGAVGGLMLLTAPPNLQIESGQIEKHYEKFHRHLYLVADLEPLLPENFRDLTSDEKNSIAKKLSDFYKLDIEYEIDSKTLNKVYGYIGAEQHLMRFPGDTEATHFQTSEEAEKFMSSGLAPGRGAWGYFANSKDSLTQKDIDREKYYIAVQTFLAPEYNSRVAEYRDFFKYRKMLVVNPHNGKAVVVVIGDAGPAQWTGKHLGGSPEVMRHLERFDGSIRGPVLYFFIDDPEDKVPLGPIETN